MAIFQAGFDFHGVYCYRSKEEPQAFYFFPGEPEPELDARGKPTLILWASELGAILQLGVQWQPDADLLEKLRDHLVEKFPDLEREGIQLSQVQVKITGVTLALGDGEGKFETLQTAASSGYPPYTTLFHKQLTAEQKPRAVAALHGNQGFLRVTYSVTLPAEVTVEAAISGDVRQDIAALGSSPAFSDCLARIEMAITAGRLHLEFTESAPAPDALRQKAGRLAKHKAAAALQRMARSGIVEPDESTLEASVSLTEIAEVPLERVTDISSWFSDGCRDEHIRELPTAGEIPKEIPTPVTTQTVKLDFDLADAPIAFIQLTCGETTKTLRGPKFEPVTLAVSETGKPLVVKTFYSFGGIPFEATVATPGPEGWILTPADLGLVKVVVDGSRLQAEGARQARVVFHYAPTGQGMADDRIITLRRNTWAAEWFLITRNTELDGVIEYEWTETPARGGRVKHAKTKKKNPEINL